MGEPRTIAGCLVLKEAAAREPSRYKVVICQLPVTKGESPRYMVWYIDDKTRPTEGQSYNEREAAQSEFERRT